MIKKNKTVTGTEKINRQIKLSKLINIKDNNKKNRMFKIHKMTREKVGEKDLGNGTKSTTKKTSTFVKKIKIIHIKKTIQKIKYNPKDI